MKSEILKACWVNKDQGDVFLLPAFWEVKILLTTIVNHLTEATKPIQRQDALNSERSVLVSSN